MTSHKKKHYYRATRNEGNTSSKKQSNTMKIGVGAFGHVPIFPLTVAGMIIAPPILSAPIAVSSLLWWVLEKRANKRPSASMVKEVIDNVIKMLSNEFGLTERQLNGIIAKLRKNNVLSADFFAGMENAFAKGGKDNMSYYAYYRLRQYFA